MATGDDSVPSAYPYVWTPESDITLKDFLNKYKPSMVQNDGTKPWIWVRKADTANDYGDEAAATEEASGYLQEIVAKIENVKNDDSIPVRANKKKGLRSKKEVREEVQAEASEKLKEISVRYGFVHGKWLIFAAPDQVDAIWTTVATSLINGPLSSTAVSGVAKVATSPQNDTPNYRHVICLYVPNVYDKEKLLEVMKVLLGQHGMNLMGVKSDLYTMIGLDSKHPSGVQSTVWKNSALMKDSEMKELKDKYFAGLKAAKAEKSEKPTAGAATIKAKPALKKGLEDPFASDDEEKSAPATSQADIKPSSKAASRSKPKAALKKPQVDAFGSDEDEDEAGAESTRKAEVAEKKAQAKHSTSKRARVSNDEEDEDKPEPKKRQARK